MVICSFRRTFRMYAKRHRPPRSAFLFSNFHLVSKYRFSLNIYQIATESLASSKVISFNLSQTLRAGSGGGDLPQATTGRDTCTHDESPAFCFLSVSLCAFLPHRSVPPDVKKHGGIFMSLMAETFSVTWKTGPVTK